LRLTLWEHPDGYETAAGNRVLYDVAANEAHFGAARVEGRALRWELGEHDRNGAKLSAEVELDPAVGWLVRCDRVDFPPGATAYRHTHPGPGIRCLLAGELRVEAGGEEGVYLPFQAWFESGPEPVVAASTPIEATSFVRVLLLPREWAGKRTIAYVDLADAEKPKTQRATVLLDVPIDL
jgi:hypothetical protein